MVGRLHYEIVSHLLEQGACPSNEHLSELLDLNSSAFQILLHDLAAIHGVVLHPYAAEPWVIHPFSSRRP